MLRVVKKTVTGTSLSTTPLSHSNTVQALPLREHRHQQLGRVKGEQEGLDLGGTSNSSIDNIVHAHYKPLETQCNVSAGYQHSLGRNVNNAPSSDTNLVSYVSTSSAW
jgi:hypothetical protein